jgi:hypothetical protein
MSATLFYFGWTFFDPENQNLPRNFPAGKQHQKARGVSGNFFKNSQEIGADGLLGIPLGIPGHHKIIISL